MYKFKNKMIIPYKFPVCIGEHIKTVWAVGDSFKAYNFIKKERMKPYALFLIGNLAGWDS